TPPAGLPDGEYWARLIISARGGRLPVAGVGDTAAVRVQLNLVVNTNIGLAYRKGPVATGVALSQLRARLVGDSVEVWSRLSRRVPPAILSRRSARRTSRPTPSQSRSWWSSRSAGPRVAPYPRTASVPKRFYP